LEYINSDDWDDCDGFLVFGKEAFESWLEDPLRGGDTPDSERLRKLANKLRQDEGARAVAGKVTLGTPPPDSKIADIVKWLQELEPEQQRMAIAGLQELAKEGAGAKGLQRKHSESDAIDAALAADFLRMLDGAVAQIETYDDINIRNTHPKVARYFEEAHRCLLFGLDVACAVLCRSLLESALIDRVDKGGNIRRNTGSGESYISNMIKEATGKSLSDDRPEAAERIKDAGNLAVHKYDIFRKKYSDRMAEIVDDTRKVLIDLYGDERITSASS
jgi:hypothetical protein